MIGVRVPSLRTAVAIVALALVASACLPLPPPPEATPPASGGSGGGGGGGAPPPSPLAPPPPDIALPANSPNLATNGTFVTQTFDGAANQNIDHPWDIAFVDSTTALFTERAGRISSFNPTTGGTAKLVGTIADTFASGESGLMGIAIDPAFSSNNYIYVCMSSTTGGNHNEIRRFTVDLSKPAGQSGLSAAATMLTGMPAANFHDGCRIRFQPNTNPPALWITMGDAGIGPGPQDLTSLAGKILRVEVDTGVLQAYPGNPFIGSANANTKVIYTYGHRNPQGITFQPGSNVPYNAEHGPNINDEVNRLEPAGGNAGWDPNTNGSYDSLHPMTDVAKFPNAIQPAWRSGDSFTLAPSGATFLSGAQWKSWENALVVAFLKDSKVRVMFLDGQGNVTGAYPTLTGGGRLRSVVEGPDGYLYVTTDNGVGNDAIRKVVPS